MAGNPCNSKASDEPPLLYGHPGICHIERDMEGGAKEDDAK